MGSFDCAQERAQVPSTTHPSRIPNIRVDDPVKQLQADSATAVRYIRRMRGGSQPHLLRCSDGYHYVVKFQNNPQGCRTLASDLLGTLLAESLGLPVEPPCVIDVSPLFIEGSRKLTIELATRTIACQPGRCFGSRYPIGSAARGNPLLAVVIDFWQTEGPSSVSNLADCVGVYVFDQWTCNSDTRQFLFSKTLKERRWKLSMIDQGSCFNGGRWNFPDSPLWGLHHGLARYLAADKFEVFEPWLDRLESVVDLDTVYAAAQRVPAEWYDGEQNALDRLVDELDRRRYLVRDLVWRLVKFSCQSLPRSLAGQGQSRCQNQLGGLRVLAEPETALDPALRTTGSDRVWTAAEPERLLERGTVA